MISPLLQRVRHVLHLAVAVTFALGITRSVRIVLGGQVAARSVFLRPFPAGRLLRGSGCSIFLVNSFPSWFSSVVEITSQRDAGSRAIAGSLTVRPSKGLNCGCSAPSPDLQRRFHCSEQPSSRGARRAFRRRLEDLLRSHSHVRIAAEKSGVNSLVGVAPKTEDFALEAPSSDIGCSQSAVERSHDATKAFGQQIITDHQKTLTN